MGNNASANNSACSSSPPDRALTPQRIKSLWKIFSSSGSGTSRSDTISILRSIGVDVDDDGITKLLSETFEGDPILNLEELQAFLAQVEGIYRQIVQARANDPEVQAEEDDAADEFDEELEQRLLDLGFPPIPPTDEQIARHQRQSEREAARRAEEKRRSKQKQENREFKDQDNQEIDSATSWYDRLQERRAARRRTRQARRTESKKDDNPRVVNTTNSNSLPTQFCRPPLDIIALRSKYMRPSDRGRLTTYYTDAAMMHDKKDFQSSKFDKFNNPTGSKFDLGQDYMFSEFVVLIGCFYYEPCSHPLNICENSVEALHQKGFNVIVCFNEDDFINYLPQCDVAWLISHSSWRTSNNETKRVFVQRLQDFHHSGKGLCIFGDNDPYYFHANLFLEAEFKTSLMGNTPGAKVMQASQDPDRKQCFGSHLLTSGIASLFEGVTIAYPRASYQNTMKLLATSSDNHPVIVYADNQPRGTLAPDVGRLVVDCAFTKLYISWDSAGTARYVSNISVWLLGLDNKIRYDMPISNSLSSRLEKRAAKNKSEAEKRDRMLIKARNSLDFAAIAQSKEAKEAASFGSCVISSQTWVEALEEGDCLCISLDVSRSQGAIMDPAQVVIRAVNPSLITAESFIDAVEFAVRAAPRDNKSSVHGGFDITQTWQVCVGAAREPISGAFPLYINQWHWRVARHKLNTLLGWTATLDRHGFMFSQLELLPFMMLAHAARDAKAGEADDSTTLSSQNSYRLLLQTCCHIMKDLSKSVLVWSSQDEAEAEDLREAPVPAAPGGPVDPDQLPDDAMADENPDSKEGSKQGNDNTHSGSKQGYDAAQNEKAGDSKDEKKEDRRSSSLLAKHCAQWREYMAGPAGRTKDKVPSHAALLGHCLTAVALGVRPPLTVQEVDVLMANMLEEEMRRKQPSKLKSIEPAELSLLIEQATGVDRKKHVDESFMNDYVKYLDHEAKAGNTESVYEVNFRALASEYGRDLDDANVVPAPGPTSVSPTRPTGAVVLVEPTIQDNMPEMEDTVHTMAIGFIASFQTTFHHSCLPLLTVRNVLLSQGVEPSLIAQVRIRDEHKAEVDFNIDHILTPLRVDERDELDACDVDEREDKKNSPPSSNLFARKLLTGLKELWALPHDKNNNHYGKKDNEVLQVALALGLQNVHHSRNVTRRQAIEDGSYVNLTQAEGLAQLYLQQMFAERVLALRRSAKAAELTRRTESSNESRAQDFGNTRSLAEAAGCLIGVYQGSTAFHAFVDQLAENDCPNMMPKLKMLIGGEYKHVPLIKDRLGAKAQRKRAKKIQRIGQARYDEIMAAKSADEKALDQKNASQVNQNVEGAVMWKAGKKKIFQLIKRHHIHYTMDEWIDVFPHLEAYIRKVYAFESW